LPFLWWEKILPLEKALQKPLSEKNVVLDKVLLGKLSLLQQKILLELANRPLTLSDLSEKTGSSIYTIGKQLSLLQMRADYNPLNNKGISKPLVKKQKDAGIKTIYFIIPGL